MTQPHILRSLACVTLSDWWPGSEAAQASTQPRQLWELSARQCSAPKFKLLLGSGYTSDAWIIVSGAWGSRSF